MKSGSWTYVVLAGIVALLSHFSSRRVEASGINIHGEVQGVRWSINGDEQSPEGIAQIWLNAQVDSSIHRVENVSQGMSPTWGGQPTEWNWYANFSGTKNAPLNQMPFSMSFHFTSPAAQLDQYTGLSYYQWEDEPAVNSAFASISVSPSEISYCWANYGEWVEDQNPLVVHWYMNMNCQNDFGPGPGGLAAAQAVFGTPEPGSLSLLTLGALATLRRRR